MECLRTRYECKTTKKVLCLKQQQGKSMKKPELPNRGRSGAPVGQK